MKLSMLAFSEKGLLLAERLKTLLPDDLVTAERCPKDGLRDWTERQFDVADALVFVGAVGIAVRAIAPFVEHKTADPAALVIDECAEFVIPILSGHIGGGNALAKRLADLLGALAVITTATDCNGLFAVDSWAVSRGYAICNPERIRQVSARLLAGETIRLKSGFAAVLDPALARQILLTGQPPFDVRIDVKPHDDSALLLIPPVLTLGVGCKRYTPASAIHAAFDRLCADFKLEPRAFGRVCSVDLKANEPGLLTFCEDRKLPFVTFSADALTALPGVFTPSDFVRQTVGVDNVCERSAVLGSGGALMIKKQALDGVTLAVARAEHIVRITP